MYNRNEFYSVDQLETLNLNSLSLNDLHDLYAKLQDAFYHTSVNAENNLKDRIGTLKRNVFMVISTKNMNKALSQIEKDFKK